MVMCAAHVYTSISIRFGLSGYPDTDGILIPGAWVLANVNDGLIGLVTVHKVLVNCYRNKNNYDD